VSNATPVPSKRATEDKIHRLHGIWILEIFLVLGCRFGSILRPVKQGIRPFEFVDVSGLSDWTQAENRDGPPF
jgi:hypothetical protein